VRTFWRTYVLPRESEHNDQGRTNVVVMEPPQLHFPIGVPFHSGDQFNKERGNWFYRHPAGGALKGPFASFDAAGRNMIGMAESPVG